MQTFNPAAWVGYEIDKLNPMLPEVIAPLEPIMVQEYGVGIGVDPIGIELLWALTLCRYVNVSAKSFL